MERHWGATVCAEQRRNTDQLRNPGRNRFRQKGRGGTRKVHEDATTFTRGRVTFPSESSTCAPRPNGTGGPQRPNDGPSSPTPPPGGFHTQSLAPRPRCPGDKVRVSRGIHCPNFGGDFLIPYMGDRSARCLAGGGKLEVGNLATRDIIGRLADPLRRRGAAPPQTLPLDFVLARATKVLRQSPDPTTRPDVVETLNATLFAVS